ncbi:hypothetical protein MMC31_003319 [Peltigera leucophlebia]|nr:hypothetical protein [Peltigera leucophlebia]
MLLELHKQSIYKSNHIGEAQVPPSPLASKFPEGRILPPRSQILHKPSKLCQKRERGQEIGYSSPQGRDWPPSKRFRTSSASCTAEGGIEEESQSNSNKNADPLETWIQCKRWPSEYFEQDSQAGKSFFEHDSWLEDQMEQSSIPVVPYVEINGSDSSLTGSSNQNKREGKIAPYRDNRYTMLLAAKGSYMRELDDYETPKNIKDLCQTLLERDQTVPQDSLFRDDLFRRTCREIDDRNEAKVIQDIARLIVQSAESLVKYGARHLDHLIENVDEGWTEGIPVEGPRPQPNYSVGFRRSTFTDEQLNRLDPLIGSVYDTSFFVAT